MHRLKKIMRSVDGKWNRVTIKNNLNKKSEIVGLSFVAAVKNLFAIVHLLKGCGLLIII